MVDNKHKQIKGYRNLSEQEIALINEAKELSEKIGEFVDKVQSKVSGEDVSITIDPRWLAIGRTDLQTGFMALIRSIARPTIF